MLVLSVKSKGVLVVVANAILVRIPLTPALTWTMFVTVADAPAEIVPRLEIAVPPTKVVPSGIMSVKTTLVAAFGPKLLTVFV